VSRLAHLEQRALAYHKPPCGWHDGLTLHAAPSVASGGSVLVDHEVPLKVRAFKAGLGPSPVRRGDYRITGEAVAARDEL
jgi:hypothetical protein